MSPNGSLGLGVPGNLCLSLCKSFLFKDNAPLKAYTSVDTVLTN